MQRIRADRLKKILIYFIPLLIIGVFVFLDLFVKRYIKNLYTGSTWTETEVIRNFFYIRYDTNTGAAWSFLAGVSWAQTFFKVLTVIALIGFGIFFVISIRKKCKLLNFSLILIISGTIGNFIDRVEFSFVVDFIRFKFGEYNFPTFNFADSYMTVGIILLFINFLFVDKNALFKKDGSKNVSNN